MGESNTSNLESVYTIRLRVQDLFAAKLTSSSCPSSEAESLYSPITGGSMELQTTRAALRPTSTCLHDLDTMCCDYGEIANRKYARI